MKQQTLTFLLAFSLFVPKIGLAGANDSIFKNSFERTFFIGGQAAVGDIVVKLNNFENYTIPNSGPYVIPYPLENGSDYSVELISSPNKLLCSIQNNTGTINGEDILEANAVCGTQTTIYDVKQENVLGTVSIENVIVTACKDSLGFWVQTIPGDSDYIGDDYSGSFVFKNNMMCSGSQPLVKMGDRVSLIAAETNEFFNQIQLIPNEITILSSNNTLPQPIDTTIANISGIEPSPLEGAHVRVQDATVTAVQTPPGPAENSPSNTFQVNNQLLVDDEIYLTTPFPEINDYYFTITGISAYKNTLSKLFPRFSQDIHWSTDGQIDLVINEVDYNQSALDDEEFIEIFNPSNQPISLNNVTLYFINGSNNTDYAQIDLSELGTLDAGQFLVIGSSNMINEVASGALTLEFENSEGQIQNGNPEGLVLYNKALNSKIDSLSYGGDMTTATLTDINMQVNVTEVSGSVADSTSIDGSIIRRPNGADTDNNSNDFQFTTSISPGAINTFTDTPELLVINEIDYNILGEDDREFIEIFNPTMSDISLSHLSLYLINGSTNTDYAQIELDSLETIQAGQYLVIGSSNMIDNVAEGALRLEFENPVAQIQNGDPDGMVLFYKSTGTVIDSLSYGGVISMATLSDTGAMVSVTEGSPTITDENDPDTSLARLPNGVDTDDNSVDFGLTTSLTPGEANLN